MLDEIQRGWWSHNANGSSILNNNLEQQRQQQQQQLFLQNAEEFEKDINDKQPEISSPMLETAVADEENVAIDIIYNDREPLTAYELSTGQTPAAATATAANAGNCNSVDR